MRNVLGLISMPCMIGLIGMGEVNNLQSSVSGTKTATQMQSESSSQFKSDIGVPASTPKNHVDVTRIDDAEAGILSVEPAIAVSTDGELIAIVWMEYTDAAFHLRAAYSSNGGLEFSYANLSAAQTPSTRGMDPMAVYDPGHDQLLFGGINQLNQSPQSPRTAFLYRMSRNGMLAPPTNILTSRDLDKGTLAVLPLDGGTRLSAVFRGHRFYSDDGGDSWSSMEVDPLVGRIQAFGANEGVLAGWRPGDSSTDGTIVGNVMVVRTSVDGALTFNREQTFPWQGTYSTQYDDDEIPGDFQTPRFPTIDVDERRSLGGELHLQPLLIWSDSAPDEPSNLNLRFIRRVGESWSEIENPAGISQLGDQFFPSVHVGVDGDIHLIWLDTRHGDASDGDSEAVLDVYYAFSFDGGFTWKETRLTDSFSTESARYDAARAPFLGDYISIASSNETVFAVYPAAPNGDMNIYMAKMPRELDVSGHWFSQSETGHGFSMQRLRSSMGQRLLLYWFHYADDGEPIWLVALGSFDGLHAELQASTVSGGEFPPNFDPASAEVSPWGTIDVQFTSENRATVSWQNTSGVAQNRALELVRATRIRRDELGCLGGAFFDPEEPGHGIVLEFVEQGRALLTWYAFHNGRPYWVQSVVVVDDPNELQFSMSAFHGAGLDNYDPDAVSSTHWGTVNLDRLSGDRWRIRWQPIDDFDPGIRILQRLTSFDGHVCP